MDISVNAEKVIAQASEWTFAGDCSLLQWMEEIGKNLEQRAKATNLNFDQLSCKLKNTSTALDNVTNSLAALQYTQFVENRCHDDDETITNMVDVPRDCVTQKEQPKDSSLVWQTFLKTNLDVLRNCHERYAVDFQDSDEEDATNNYIYQPKNPYNERLLPHIYGSKLWKEHWHCGLCDDSNSNSGDEASEAFSESSSSLSEDNESLASNAANLSEWASTASIINEKDQPQQHLIKIQNASSLRGSQPLFPPSQEYLHKPVSSESSSVASGTAPASISNNLIQNEQRFDLFAPVRNSPPATSSASSVASLQQQQPQLPNTTLESNISSRETYTKATTRRRPVNLFDDDDFNSFLTEIVEGGRNTRDEGTKAAAVEKEKSATKEQLNFFDSRSNSPVEDNEPAVQPIMIASQSSKKLPSLNLFDSRCSSPSNDELFSTVKEVDVGKVEQKAHAKISAKKLFDEDDDDDDDFLNIFANRNTNKISKEISRKQLFDDDFEEDDKLQIPENYHEKTLEEEKVAGSNGSKSITSKQPLVEEFETIDVNTIQDKNIRQQDKSQKSYANNFSAKSNQINIFDDVADNSAEDDLFHSTESEQSTKKFTDIAAADEGINKQNSQLPKKVISDINSLEETINNDCIEGPSQDNRTEIISILDSSKRGTSQVNINISQNEADKNIGDIIKTCIDPNVFNTKTVSITNSTDVFHDNTDEKVKKAEDIQQSATSDQLDSNASKLINNLFPTNTANKVNKTFAGLLIEEPPIDDAFFQNLGNNTTTESNLLQYKSNEDCDEPALPNLPTADSNITNLFAHNAYTNLGLFSEVPPDDDDLEDSNVEQSNNSSNEPKRIHSVFYDDFNETMDAVNKRKTAENTTNLHAIFYDEPPPDDDVNIFQALPQSSIKKQLIDNEDHGDVAQTSAKSFRDKVNVADTTTSTIEKPALDIKTIQSTKSDGISKLKMSKLKIDVKALLPPGANSVSQSFVEKSAKCEKELAPDNNIETLINSAICPSSTSNSNEDILVNVCKNRVRAPAKRRPSTRRGRQENYRKSLIARQEEEALIEQQIEYKPTSSEDNQNMWLEMPKPKVTGMFAEDSKTKSDNTYEINTTTSNFLDHKTKHNTDFSKQVVTQNNPLKSSMNKTIAPNEVVQNLRTTRGLFDDDDDEEENDNFLFLSKSNKPNSLKTNRLNAGSNADASILTESYSIDYTKSSYENKHSTSSKIDVSLKKSRENPLRVKKNEVFQDKSDTIIKDVCLSNKESENKIKMLSTAAGLFDDAEIETLKASNTQIKSFQRSEEVVNISKKQNNKNFDKDIFDDTDDDILFGALKRKPSQEGTKKPQFSNVTEAVSNEIMDENKIFKHSDSKVNSLFDSDDENESNDDDSFFSSKKTTLIKASGKVDSQTLFSDTDDDDDNLFCNKAASSKTSNNKVITKLKHEPRKTADSFKTTTTDNPLADLLGN